MVEELFEFEGDDIMERRPAVLTLKAASSNLAVRVGGAIEVLRRMSAYKQGTVVQTDRLTDRQTDRQTVCHCS